MPTPSAGFVERPHTADWELAVWAPDLPTLFEQAARGMYTLAGLRLQEGPHLKRRLELQAIDDESLLVQFLDELLYLQGVEGIVFEKFQLQITGNELKAELDGAPVASLDKEIKAVTYHNMKIQAGPCGLEVRIVFDV